MQHPRETALDGTDLHTERIARLSGLDGCAGEGASLVFNGYTRVLVNGIVGSGTGLERPYIHDERVNGLFAGVAHGRLHGDGGAWAEIHRNLVN